MSKLILLIFFLITICFIQAQNSLLNEAKYWMWRDRLVNDWMIPNFTGDYAHKGRGIIFKDRGIGECDYFDPITHSIIRIDGGFNISDEGFEMGKYLIVLATEWRLLFNSGLPTKQTEAEIFWALKTIDRLDYDAETYWSFFWSRGQETWGGQLNGFMIRDDVRRNFLWYNQNFPADTFALLNADFFNYQTLINEYDGLINENNLSYFVFNEDSYFNYRYLNQGYDGNRGKYYPRNAMVSSIDGNRILTLSELLNFENNFSPTNYFSAYEAGLWACYGLEEKRKTFREYHWTGPEEYSQDNYIGLLMGLVAVEQLVNSDVNVNLYGLSSYASHIIDRIIYSIKKNESFNDNWVIDNPITKKCVKGVHWVDIIYDAIDGQNQYNENKLKNGCEKGGANAGYFSRLFKLVHQYYTFHCSNCHNNNEITSQSILFESPSNENRALLVAILQTLVDVNTLISPVGIINNNPHPCKILLLAGENNYKEFCFIDLFYSWLHNKNTYNSIQFYENICNNTPCLTNELVDQLPVNLLSEMIIHNFLKLLKGEKYQYTIYDNNTYPSATTLCTQSQITFGNIVSEATITQSPTSGCKANVTYKAGKEIHLKPGFKVINGAKFHGYIEPPNVCQIKEGNPEVAVLYFPPSDEQLSPYVSNLNYTKEEIIKNNSELKETVLNNTILFYPNPAKDLLILQSETSVSYNVEIYDTMGQLIERKKVNANENITVSHLKRGIYIFKIFNQNELVQIQKIVLQ